LRAALTKSGYETFSCTYSELKNLSLRISTSVQDVLYVVSLGFVLPETAIKNFPGIKIMLGGDDPQALDYKLFSRFKRLVTQKRHIFGSYYGNLNNAKVFDLVLTPSLRAFKRYEANKIEVLYFPYWARKKSNLIKESTIKLGMSSVMNLTANREVYINLLTKNRNINFINYHGINIKKIIQIYSQSKNVFNVCTNNEVNIRYFEALSCGCPVYSNTEGHLEELQILGISNYIQSWSAKKDLEKIHSNDLITLTPNDRMNLIKMVNSKHSVQQRMDQLLEYV